MGRPGPRLDRRRGRPRSSRPTRRCNIPHMGWNTLDRRSAHPLLAGHPDRAEGPARLFRPFLLRFTAVATPSIVAATDYGGPFAADRRARQYRRHAVPSRKEPDARPRADRQFPEVAAMILYPAIDLKDGHCVRLRAGRHGEGDGVQRRSGGAGRGLRAAGLRLSACRRSRRRLRRQADEREAVEAFSPRDNAGPARRRHPRPARRSRAGSTKASPASSSARPRCAIPSWCARRRAAFPAAIAVGIDARDGKVAVEGWAERSEITRSNLAGASRTPGSPRSSIPILPATGVEGPECRGDAGARRRDLDPRHRLGRPRLARRRRALAGARLREARRRDHGPRAL